jgi:hypothetical protein
MAASLLERLPDAEWHRGNVLRDALKHVDIEGLTDRISGQVFQSSVDDQFVCGRLPGTPPEDPPNSALTLLLATRNS